MDARGAHPHALWGTRNGERAVDWWWDTPYGPGGRSRYTGPKDDDKRPALVLNTGLTREQYVAGHFEHYIKEARDVAPTDVWVDAWEHTENLYDYNTRFELCKEDTLPEERDELDRRGFRYLGSRCDSMFFENPHGRLPEMDALGRIDVTYPEEGVRLVIQRGFCMCSTFHRDHDAFYWSRVAFDGKPYRDPPRAPEPPPVDPEQVARAREERRRDREELQKRANAGDGGAKFMLALGKMAQNTYEAVNAEVLAAVIKASSLVDERIKKLWEEQRETTPPLPEELRQRVAARASLVRRGVPEEFELPFERRVKKPSEEEGKQ